MASAADIDDERDAMAARLIVGFSMGFVAGPRHVFFGAQNLGEDMLPDHPKYVASYMSRRPITMFFPLSVTISTCVTFWPGPRAVAAMTQFEVIGYTMLATLMALAVAEHGFLVEPMNAHALGGSSRAARERSRRIARWGICRARKFLRNGRREEPGR